MPRVKIVSKKSILKIQKFSQIKSGRIIEKKLQNSKILTGRSKVRKNVENHFFQIGNFLQVIGHKESRDNQFSKIRKLSQFEKIEKINFPCFEHSNTCTG